MTNQKAAVEVAKEIAQEQPSSTIRTLTSGVRVRLATVSTALLDEVTNRIKDPDVPLWRNEDKGRDEPNPLDPKYVRDLAEANRQRGIAVMDALVMFGVELVDGIPSDDSWLTKLRYLEKRGQVDLSSYDLNDPFDLEFLYKRFIAVDNDTLTAISRLSSFTEEDVEKAENSFPRNKRR
jgi:hypothetical protein